MKPENVEKWIEVADAFVHDPKSVLTCPECGVVALAVRVEPEPKMPSCEWRYMRCDACGAMETTLRDVSGSAR